MSLTDFVVSNVSISNASSPTVQSLNVGLAACFHSHYPDRVRVYSTSTVLTDLLADGFKTYEPGYKLAEAYASAPNAPALFAMGRRALPYTQTLKLTCVDGTVGDAYDFTLVSALGVSTALQYVNVATPGTQVAGTALSGTVTVTKGSTAITFSANQTLAAGTLLEFTDAPGTWYTLASAIATSKNGTLTTAYTGAGGAGETATPADTVTTVAGSAALVFGKAQTFAAGDTLVFSSQPGTYYALASPVTTTAGTLTGVFPLSGTTATYTHSAALTGTFDAVQGSTGVVSSADQTTAVQAGDSIMFASQLGVFYTVASVTGPAGTPPYTITLTNPYSGLTAAATTATLPCQVVTAAANLQAQMAALPSIGTATVTGAVITLTQVPGLLTDVQGWRANGFHSLKLQDTTADPGVATDLAAMVAANALAFYGILLDSNSAAEIKAAAAYCETFAASGTKVGLFNTSDAGNGDSTVTSDVFSALQTLSLNRCFVQHNNQQLLCYSGAATCSQAFAMNPGSYTLGYKTLPLVPADSDTTLTEGEALTINSMTASNPGPGGKSGNYYKTTAGKNWLWPGVAPSNQFFDLTIGCDWLKLQIQAAVATVLSSGPKVPFDDFGLQKIGAAIQGVLQLGASPQYGFLLPNGADPQRPLVVNTPKAASLTPSQRASRDVSGFTWSAGLQGAIQTAVVNGQLLP